MYRGLGPCQPLHGSIIPLDFRCSVEVWRRQDRRKRDVGGEEMARPTRERHRGGEIIEREGAEEAKVMGVQDRQELGRASIIFMGQS